MELLGWLVGTILSALLCLAAARPLPAPVGSDAPPPLLRPATASEITELQLTEARAATALRRARTTLGRALEPGELEGLDDQGRAWLPGGLPDNPLAPGHAGLATACPDDPQPPPVDWIYCAEEDLLRAWGLDAP